MPAAPFSISILLYHGSSYLLVGKYDEPWYDACSPLMSNQCLFSRWSMKKAGRSILIALSSLGSLVASRMTLFVVAWTSWRLYFSSMGYSFSILTWKYCVDSLVVYFWRWRDLYCLWLASVSDGGSC